MGSSKLKKAARRMVVAACASFSTAPTPTHSPSPPPPPPGPPLSISATATATARSPAAREADFITSDNNVSNKNVCAICLEALIGGSSPDAIFTAQCSHAFHFGCISSNVRHGNVTCPICRAHWTQLPRNLHPPPCNLNDPIFRILDESIATFRVHRRSFLRSARYDDDDPIDPDDHSFSSYSRFHFSLMPIPSSLLTHSCAGYPLHMNGIGIGHHHHHFLPTTTTSSSSSSLFTSGASSNKRAAYLSVKVGHQPPIDLVLVASPNGPHLRLVKQSMALVVFSLRPTDRLAIVTYSSAAARVFPLRRMTSYGKRSALQVIDRLFYMGQADPIEGLKKGMKIIEDRAHKNPQSCILHLSDSPTRTYHAINMQVPIPIHRFHVGFGFGASNGFVMHEFEEFLARLLGGIIREMQLRIGDEGRIIRLGELRGGEERRILVESGECEQVNVEYSYVEGGVDECFRTGETLVCLEDKRETSDGIRDSGAGSDTNIIIGGRSSSVESWEYHDPYMARRWAKHLHGYRL